MTAIPNSRIEKSLRLLRENRVTEITTRTFKVEGDTGTYLVTITDGLDQFCPCAFQGPGSCSHLIACNNYIARERTRDDPLAGLPSEEFPGGRPLKSV